MIFWSYTRIDNNSGDNTLERCVSMDILPFYRSTNAHAKLPTSLALRDITQLPELPISAVARESYSIFFDPDEYDNFVQFINQRRSSVTTITKYQLIDIQEMITAWPIIAAYLKREKNFYNNLEDIILEQPPNLCQKMFDAVVRGMPKFTWGSAHPYTLFNKLSTKSSKQETSDQHKKSEGPK